MTLRVVLTGGGTAGHLFPSVAVAQVLVDEMGADILFIGAEGRLDGKILAEHDMPHELVPARPFPYGVSLDALKAMWTLYRSRARCISILKDFKPDVVFGAGGYVSVAGVMAATRLRIPSVCHASDAHPDRANRLLARWATRITTNYEVAAEAFPPDRTSVVGQPVRKEFFQAEMRAARRELGIREDAFVLLVSGGSQGARTLNQATLGALNSLLSDGGSTVIHLTGRLDHDDVLRQAREIVGDHPGYHCHAFHEQPWTLIAAADLALTRGGASSLAEMSVMGLPMIIVPYPYAAAHQKLNAAPLIEAQAARMVENEDLTGELLANLVAELREYRATLLRMSEAARAASRPDAAAQIAHTIAELAGEARPEA